MCPRLLLCLALIAPLASPAETKGELDRPLSPDASIDYRVLPNGMRYWIRPDASPKGKVSLWLRVATGSLNEDDDERGIAHLLEHLAFNGSANFPAGTLIQRFQAAGLTFGAHQNATTTYTDTVYKLTVPNDPALLDLSLLYFADVAHRLTLDPAEVERERAVVEAERRSRNNAATRAFNRRIAALAPGSRLIERLPIGHPEVVQQATAEQLRAYYEKWYRPENTQLLVAGDVDVAQLEALVRKHFAAWQAAGDGPANRKPGIHMYARDRVEIIRESGLIAADIDIAHLEPPEHLTTPGDYRRSLVHSLGEHMFNWRLREQVLAGAAAFASGNIGAYTSFGKNLVEARAKGAPEDWEAVVRALLTELKRARAHGFSDAEFRHAKQVMQAECDREAAAAAAMSAEQWLDRMDAALGRQRRPLDAGELHALCARLLPTITQAEVESALRARYAPARRTFVLALPPGGAGESATQDKILAIAASVAASPVARLEERSWPARLLARDPEPGHTTERTRHPELNVVSATLANGVRVHVRPMRHRKDHVYVRITLAGGRINETPENRGITEIAALPFEVPATEALSSSDIRRIMSTRQVSVSGGATAGALHLNVRGHRDDLQGGLRLAHLLLSRAYVEPAAFARWRQEASTREINREGSVSAQLNDRVDALLTNHDPRFRELLPEDVARLTRAEGQAWLDGILAHAPIEVGIVGDIEPEQALALAEKYLGSLPPRPGVIGAYAEARALHASAGPHNALVRVNTATPKAMVYLGWRGPDWADVRDWQLLDLADRVLTSRLLAEVRERHGLVYSIRARATSDTLFRGNGRFRISFVVAPQRAQEAADLVQQVVDEFVRTGPTAEELATAREQASLSFRGGTRLPAFWLDVLSDLDYMGGDLVWVRDYLDSVQQYTRAEVHAAVRKYLRAERFVRVIGVPADMTLVQQGNESRPPVASIE